MCYNPPQNSAYERKMMGCSATPPLLFLLLKQFHVAYTNYVAKNELEL